MGARTITYPKEGYYAFQSKEQPESCPFAVYLADGVKLEDVYDEITKEEYDRIKKEETRESLTLAGEEV